MKQTELFPEPKKEEPSTQQAPWSVYRPKTIEAATKLFKTIEGTNRVQDVNNIANRFGVSSKALRDYYSMEYHNQRTKYYHEDQAAYLHKWLRNKMGQHRWNSKPVQEGDYASQNYSWDSLMRLLSTSGIDHPLVYAAKNSGYADQDNFSHYYDATEQLWSFYQAGPPPQTPIATRLYETLQEIVYPQYEQSQEQKNIQNNKAVGFNDDEDDLPF